MRARAAYIVRRSALSKHSRLSPLERALCSLFFANIASLYPPPAALRRCCPRPQLACSTAARLLEAQLKKSDWSLAFTLQESGKRVCFYLFKSIESIAAGGQPQGLSLQTVGNEQFEDFIPLTRQRCVEVATPYAPIKLCRFRGQMISAPTYFERSETNPSVALRQLPFQGRLNIFYNDTQFTHQQNQPAQSLYQAGWLSLLSVRRRV